MTEADRLRALLRSIAAQTDPRWGQQLARDAVGHAEAPLADRPMVAWTGYLAIDKRTGASACGSRNIRVNPIPAWHLEGGRLRSAKVHIVEVPDT